MTSPPPPTARRGRGDLARPELPRVNTRSQRAFDAAVARVGALPRQLDLSVPSLGAAQVVCRRVARATGSATDREALTWILHFRDRRGRLSVDWSACLSVVAATLGLEPPKVRRRPTELEAGVVAAAVASFLWVAQERVTLELTSMGVARAGQPPGVDASDVAPSSTGVTAAVDDDDDQIDLDLEILCSLFRAHVSVRIPPVWIPVPARPHGVEAAIARQWQFPLIVELARTTLRLGEGSGAVPGDAIVFDGVAAVGGAAQAWPVRLRCGTGFAEARWREGGALEMSSDFDVAEPPGAAQKEASPPGETHDAEQPPEALPGGDRPRGKLAMTHDDRAAATKASMLAAAPLEIVAEAGRLTMKAEQILALTVGSVLRLERPRSSLVELRISDRLWARGELVEIDGELAVRLTELPPPSG